MGLLVRISERVKAMAAAMRTGSEGAPSARSRHDRIRSSRVSTPVIADPLAPFWSELELFVKEDPDVVRALINLGEVDSGDEPAVRSARLPSDAADPPERPEILDVEALLLELGAKYSRGAAFPPILDGPSDPLRAYLEELGTREDEILGPIMR